MAVKLRVGDKLHLNLQLDDGTKNMPVRVFVELLDEDGANYSGPTEILHVSGGYFVEDTLTMPDEPKLTARYEVRKNDGVTPSNKYLLATEEYLKDVVGTIVTNNLDVAVSTIGSVPSDIESAVVDSLDITGTIDEGMTLEGSISSSDLEGVILDEC